MSIRNQERRRTLAGGLAITAVAVALLSAIPSTAMAGSEAPRFIPAEQVRGAWTSLAQSGRFVLPDGVALPDAPPSVLETPKSLVEDGALEVVAVYFYTCAWEDTLASALTAGDASAAAAAQKRLTDVVNLPGTREYVQDLGSWTEAIRSRFNDVDALKADVSQCTFYLEGGSR